MSGFLQDLRFALRQFRRRRSFTLATVLVLGLGLGVNTAIFSVVNALLLRSLPYRDTSRIAALYERNVGGGSEIYNEAAPGTFGDWQKFSRTFDEIGAYVTGPITVGAGQGGGSPQRVDAAAASRQMFIVLGLSPASGPHFYSRGRPVRGCARCDYRLRSLAAALRRRGRHSRPAHPPGWSRLRSGGRNAAGLRLPRADHSGLATLGHLSISPTHAAARHALSTRHRAVETGGEPQS